ncbi:MAG TPA: hypothetical protein DCQ08_01785 [Amoebophilaceae bacterium]|nr:hypothetical protein [Amoebophilaceae bacterium]
MQFSFFIAQRYFQLKAKKNLIHRIGLVSFMSIGVSTMALLLVLSVFNGLEGLIGSLFRSFDPDIKITLKKGKTFALDASLRQQIETTQGVFKVVDVLEDNALLRYREHQAIIKLKGVSEEFLHQSRLEPFIRQGSFKLKQGAECFAVLGSGVQYALSVPLSNQFCTLQVFYPRNMKDGTLLPQQLYRCKNIRPGSVFAVEKQFDESYVIVPIDFAASLMGMENKGTALEIQVADGFSIDQVQQALKLFVPDCFQVLNSNEQQATLMQAIHIERLFVFVTFSFILLVASLNIFFILSMLVLEKRKDVAVLYTLGATPGDIRGIFLIEGLLIALSGAAVGMAAAWGLSWLQQTFGLVSLGAQTSLVDAYPIKRKVSDFVYTAIGVVLMTLIAAHRPAQLAAKIKVRIHL